MPLVGYIYTGPRTLSEDEQREIINAEGEIISFIVDHKSRERRDDAFARGLQVRSGDALVIVSEAYLGDGKLDRLWALDILENTGVSIMVPGGEPVLYTDQEEIEAFLDRAVKASRVRNGMVLAKEAGPGPGRPRKVDVTEGDWEAARYFWSRGIDWRIVASFLAEKTEERAKTLPGISHQNLSMWFGPRNKSKQVNE